MIDTLRIYQPLFKSMHKGSINLKKFNLHYSVTGEVVYINTFYNDRNKQPVTIKFNETKDYVTITFSVPKIVYGSSIFNYSHTEFDNDLLIASLSSRLRDIIEIDFLDMLVSRLDIAINVIVDCVVGAYLRAIKYCMDVSKRFKVQEYKESSLTIYNKSKRIIFYDKEQEQMQSKDLEGIYYEFTGKVLRFEIQLRDMKTIKKELGLGSIDLTLQDVLQNPGLFKNYLVKMFRKITKDYALSSDLKKFQNDLGLIKKISEDRSRNVLFYFLIAKHVKDFDIETYDPLLLYAGYSKRSIYNMKNKLREIEALNPVSEDFDLIKELDQKIENFAREIFEKSELEIAK